MYTQEVAFKTTCSRIDQGGYEAMSLEGDFPSNLYCGCSPTDPSQYLQVCPELRYYCCRVEFYRKDTSIVL